MSNILKFKSNFPVILKEEVEKVLGERILKVGDRFESWDSYAYPLQSESGNKLVGKIYRFPNWPEKGQLEAVARLLVKGKIPHENILDIFYEHSVFRYGWQLSRFIPGGTAHSLRKKGELTDGNYYFAVGKLLAQIHAVGLPFFGSLHVKREQHQSFQDFVERELADYVFEKLPQKYKEEVEILRKAKDQVLRLLTTINFGHPVLVHEDAGDRNIIWNNGNPILIDWVDAIAGPPFRDFTTLTFRSDERLLGIIEKGYGRKVDSKELYFYQLVRFIRLAHFYYFEDKDFSEFELMAKRLRLLLNQEVPFGA